MSLSGNLAEILALPEFGMVQKMFYYMLLFQSQHSSDSNKTIIKGDCGSESFILFDHWNMQY